MKHIIPILIFGITLSTNAQIFNEIQFYGETFDNCAENAKIDSSLYWYGVYLTDSGEYSKLIKAKVLYEKERQRLYTISNQTDIHGNAIFYIGLRNKIPEKRVSFLGKDFSRKNLYPGEIHTLYTRGNVNHSIELFSLGNVKDYDYCPIIEGYQLILTNSNLKLRTIRQEIYSHIKIENKCQMALLSWFGDVDGDDKVDFIIITTTHKVRKHHLFLSTLANKDNYVGKPLEFLIGSCY